MSHRKWNRVSIFPATHQSASMFWRWAPAEWNMALIPARLSNFGCFSAAARLAGCSFPHSATDQQAADDDNERKSGGELFAARRLNGRASIAYYFDHAEVWNSGLTNGYSALARESTSHALVAVYPSVRCRCCTGWERRRQCITPLGGLWEETGYH